MAESLAERDLIYNQIVFIDLWAERNCCPELACPRWLFRLHKIFDHFLMLILFRTSVFVRRNSYNAYIFLRNLYAIRLWLLKFNLEHLLMYILLFIVFSIVVSIALIERFPLDLRHFLIYHEDGYDFFALSVQEVYFFMFW